MRPSIATLSIVASLAVASAATASARAIMFAPRPDAAAPVLIALGRYGLQTWPIGPGSHLVPKPIPGTRRLSGYGMATDGRHLVFGSANALTIYDIKTARTSMLPDPGGIPVDVAVGSDGTYYAANYTKAGGNVAVYPQNAAPAIVHCSLLSNPSYIAVDGGGNVYINQNAGTSAVVEIPRGPNGLDGSKCTSLALTPGVSGYAAGIAIEPKSGDLLILDDPDYCAGGVEGRLTTYQRPYGATKGHSIVVGRSCSGDLRYDAMSQTVFVGDTSVDESSSYILARHYPGGEPAGFYNGGNPGGFVPLP